MPPEEPPRGDTASSVSLERPESRRAETGRAATGPPSIVTYAPCVATGALIRACPLPRCVLTTWESGESGPESCYGSQNRTLRQLTDEAESRLSGVGTGAQAGEGNPGRTASGRPIGFPSRPGAVADRRCAGLGGVLLDGDVLTGTPGIPLLPVRQPPSMQTAVATRSPVDPREAVGKQRRRSSVADQHHPNVALPDTRHDQRDAGTSGFSNVKCIGAQPFLRTPVALAFPRRSDIGASIAAPVSLAPGLPRSLVPNLNLNAIASDPMLADRQGIGASDHSSGNCGAHPIPSPRRERSVSDSNRCG